VMHVVLPPLLYQTRGASGAGGGGGGNRQRGPIRHAEGIGRDRATLRTTSTLPASHATEPTSIDVKPTVSTLTPVLLDARPLASGNAEQLGLPVGGVAYGTSTGSGSGGGVGTGVGTGIGPGRGPGIGPGSGGGTGGGVYRPGAGVSAPRLLFQTKPRFTHDALRNRIQGSVWLELVVTRDGGIDGIRVVRSLDPGGLDEEAVAAVRRWVFEPGRRGETPVDVLVTVAMDFTIQ
jgi:protein TonB